MSTSYSAPIWACASSVGDALVDGAEDEDLASRVVLVDDRLRRIQRQSRLTADDVEDVLEHDRRGQRAARIEQRGELPPLVLLAPVQPRVLHGDRGGQGEQTNELPVFVGEVTDLARLDEREAADHAFLDDEGHRHRRQLAPFLHELLVERVGTLGIGVALVHHALEKDPVVARTVGERPDRADPVVVRLGHLARPRRRGDDRLALGVVLVDVALPDAERLGDTARDALEDVLERETGGEGGPHLAGDLVMTSHGPVALHGRRSCTHASQYRHASVYP